MPEGQGQAIFTGGFAEANGSYNSSGRLTGGQPYRKFDGYAYVEYGALSWLTVVGDVEVLKFNGSTEPFSTSPAPQYTGLGVGSFGARLPVGEFAGFFVSTEVSLRAAPTRAQTFLDIKGWDQIDARMQVFRGFALFDLPAFADVEVGYRTRGQVGAEIRADLTFGLRPRPDFMVLAQSFLAFAPNPGPQTAVAAEKFELSAVYELSKNLSAQAGVVVAPAGVNAPAERGVILALWTRF